MTKRPKRTSRPTTLGVIVAIIIAVIAALQSAQKTAAPAPTTVVVTELGLITATAVLETSAPTATLAAITTRQPTRVPPTDLPGLVITPINGALYEVTGSVGALGCPDSHCKEISIYKKGNILVVTGSVMGTTYKTKKTRIWYQVISHDGSKVYVHAAYVQPHDTGSR